MCRLRRIGRWRAIVGALAIYAVLVQGLLAGMAGPSLAGIVPGLCATDGPQAGSHPAAPGPSHGDHGCCLPSAAPTSPPLAMPPSGLVAWPDRVAARLSWQPWDAYVATGPPPSSVRARGPPRA